MLKSRNLKLSGLCLILGGSLFFVGCGHENPNYKAPGTGTYDGAKLDTRQNKDLLLFNMTGMAENPTEGKAQIACRRLGEMGAFAESSLPVLERVVEQSQYESVREEAKQAIEKIKADLAGETAEE